MILKDFYRITQQQVSQETPGKYSFSIELNTAHPIFGGHFPGNPVVPGVCLTEIIRELTEIIVQTPIQLKSANYIKFMSVVNPLEHPAITVEIKINQQDTPEIQAESTIFAQNTVFLKFKGSFGK